MEDEAGPMGRRQVAGSVPQTSGSSEMRGATRQRTIITREDVVRSSANFA